MSEVEKPITQYRNDFWLGQRAEQYKQVSAWIIANTPQKASILCSEVGMIGFLTNRRMFDHFGRITGGPNLSLEKAVDNKAYNADYVLWLLEDESDNKRQLTEYDVLKDFRLIAFFPVRIYKKKE